MSDKKYIEVKPKDGENLVPFICRLHEMQREANEGQVFYGSFVVRNPEKRFSKRKVYLEGTSLPLINPNFPYNQVEEHSGFKDLREYLEFGTENVGESHFYQAINKELPIIITADELRFLAQTEDPELRKKNIDNFIHLKISQQIRLQEIHSHQKKDKEEVEM